MSELQRQIIDELGVNPQLTQAEPQAEIDRRVTFLAEYARSLPGVRGFVLGISGGQDSSLAGRLTQLAAERLRDAGHEATFVAVRLPYTAQHDEEDAQRALSFIAADTVVSIDIAPAVDALVKSVNTATGRPLSDLHRGNVKARMRMIAQYALAGEGSLLVVGTDHAAESVTGFFTKFGDGAADVLPLAGLTKRQGAQLLQQLGASARLWQKTPTADLLDSDPGQSDESSLGVSYTDIDNYLSGHPVEHEAAATIERWYLASAHKRHPPVTPADTWWRTTA